MMMQVQLAMNGFYLFHSIFFILFYFLSHRLFGRATLISTENTGTDKEHPVTHKTHITLSQCVHGI